MISFIPSCEDIHTDEKKKNNNNCGLVNCQEFLCQWIMEPELNVGPLAARSLLPPGLKQCHVSKDQEKTSPCHWEESRPGTGEREAQGSLRKHYSCSCPFPRGRFCALSFRPYSWKRGWHLLRCYSPIKGKLVISCLYVPFPLLILQESNLFQCHLISLNF